MIQSKNKTIHETLSREKAVFPDPSIPPERPNPTEPTTPISPSTPSTPTIPPEKPVTPDNLLLP